MFYYVFFLNVIRKEALCSENINLMNSKFLNSSMQFRIYPNLYRGVEIQIYDGILRKNAVRKNAEKVNILKEILL